VKKTHLQKAKPMNKPKTCRFMVHGLTGEQYSQLCDLVHTHKKPSLSALVRQELIKLLARPQRQPEPLPRNWESQDRKPLRVRLPEPLYTRFKQDADREGMSINAYVAYLLMGLYSKETTVTQNEITAIYQSNAQLSRLGNNLNQIAKALNAVHYPQLDNALIRDLRHTVDGHIKAVNGLILRSQSRF